MSRIDRKVWRVLAVLFAFTLLAAACGDDDDDNATGNTDQSTTSSSTSADVGGVGRAGNGTLEIGYLLPQTGDLSFLGDPMIKAVKMALRDINAAGGVLDKDVVLFESDDGTNEDLVSYTHLTLPTILRV